MKRNLAAITPVDGSDYRHYRGKKEISDKKKPFSVEKGG
jgi:hypothetical protein